MTNPTKSSARGSSNAGFIAAIAAVVVVGLLFVAYLATNRDSGVDDLAADATADVTIEGDSLPPFPEGTQVSDPATDPAAGLVAPNLTGTDIYGEPLSITNDGRPKVIYFVAHWCAHCQREVPLVESMIENGKVPEGVDIYAVSTGVIPDRGNFPPGLWLQQEGFSPPAMRDSTDSNAYQAFGAGGFPYVIYLDSENKVVVRSSGELPEATIESLWQATAPAGGDPSGTE
ncbi:MAG: TlpA family protein disulfide reductase [Acidimicrobiales bacterium]